MNKTTITLFAAVAIAAIAFVLLGSSKQSGSGSGEPWSEKQLMPPAELAKAIKDGKAGDIHVFNIGPSGLIKGAVDVGEGRNPANIAKLKGELGQLQKDAQVVVYCGCCPFKNCPNIRPAFGLLNEMGFTNHKLLDLSDNLKVDWIDKGYPMD
ncbi:MAG TPA: rhodanese-like domain-containing protein [Flavobacteriales bacterium]|nr:rhodanese-like domain-containing protein [Flavobacteriales bacterium]